VCLDISGRRSLRGFPSYSACIASGLLTVAACRSPRWATRRPAQKKAAAYVNKIRDNNSQIAISRVWCPAGYLSSNSMGRSGWGPEADPDPEMPKHTDYRWWHAPSLYAVIRILAARPSALAGGHSASRCGGGQLARAEIAVPDVAPGAAGLKTGRLCRSFSCRCGVRGTGGLTPIHSQPRGDGLSQPAATTSWGTGRVSAC